MCRLLHSSLSFRIKSNFQPSRDCLIALTNWNINGRKILFHIVARTIFRYILYNLLRLTLLTFNDIPAARELARSSSLIDRFGKRSPPNSIVSKSKSGIGRQRDVEVFKKGPWRGKACVVASNASSFYSSSTSFAHLRLRFISNSCFTKIKRFGRSYMRIYFKEIVFSIDKSDCANEYKRWRNISTNI